MTFCNCGNILCLEKNPNFNINFHKKLKSSIYPRYSYISDFYEKRKNLIDICDYIIESDPKWSGDIKDSTIHALASSFYTFHEGLHLPKEVKIYLNSRSFIIGKNDKELITFIDLIRESIDPETFEDFVKFMEDI